MMGSLAMVATIAGETMLGLERPTNTSQSFKASARVRSFVSAAKKALFGSMFSSRP